MSDDVRFERLLADVLADSAPTGAPDRLVPDILAAARRARRTPRWLALAIERPMRRRAEVLVGSPRLRLAYLLVLAMLIALLGAATLVAGGVLPRPQDPIIMIPQPTRFAHSNSAFPSQPSRPVRNGLIAVVSAADLLLIDPATGRTVKTLRDNPADSPDWNLYDVSWAPDGQRLAYVESGGIWVMDVTNLMAEEIMYCGYDANGCDIAWAPDGTQIAVARNGRLELLDPTGDNRTTLLERPGLGAPVWSPDGRRIAFGALSDAGEAGSVFVVQRDGSGIELLLSPPPGGWIRDPSWSPDGSTIAYIAATDHGPCPRRQPREYSSCEGDRQLSVMIAEIGASEPRELLAAGHCFCLGFVPGLTWSPDGTALALVMSRDDEFGGLNVVNADGTGLRHLADGWGSPAWQPMP